MSEIIPPRYPSPVPQIPRQSKAPLELLYQEIGDDEPTLKMKVPPHLLAQTRGPNYGLIGALLFCLAFWGSIAYLVLR
jgi:hypothetical protein